MESILNQIIPIAITALISILLVIIKSVGEAVIKFIEVKKEEVITKIGAEKYKQEKATATDLWNLVDEHFRLSGIIGNIMNDKIDMFDKLIKEKIPYLTDEQIITLRQSIAGQINAGKEAIVKDATVITPVDKSVQDTIATLHSSDPAPDLNSEQPQV